MQLFNNLIKNSPSADLFLQYQLNDQLYICYKVYSKHEDQLKLMKYSISGCSTLRLPLSLPRERGCLSLGALCLPATQPAA